jgi:hypothetical protein
LTVPEHPLTYPEPTMNISIQSFAIRTLALSALAAVAMSSANAGVIFYRTRVFVAPVVAAPIFVSPVAAMPVAAAVYVPTCNFVSIPVVNAYTGWTYMVTRRVCN